MVATLSHGDVVKLTRDSLELADFIDHRCGGPPPEKAAEFYRARAILEGIQSDIDADGLGFLPLMIVPWLLLAAGTVVAVATIPSAIAGARKVTDAATTATTRTIGTIETVTRYATYGALALGAYWATKVVTRKAG